MKHELIPASGHYYKANLHNHTTVSDGRHTPEEIKAHYKAHGYSIVAFTDHDVMVPHPELNDENFLAITSYEVETNGEALGGTWMGVPTYHLNFYAKNPLETHYPCPNPGYCFGNGPAYAAEQPNYKGDYVRRYSVEGQNEMIAEAKRLGYLVSYNHPDWSLQHYNDYAGLEGFTALEVYNTGCVVEGYHLDTSDHVLDEFLNMGKRVFPVATDDNHGDHDMCGGWVRFKAPALTYDAIMTAYERGDFYASWGPEIEDLTLEDGILRVTCTPGPSGSPVTQIVVSTGLRWRRVTMNEAGLTEATFDLTDYISETRRTGIADHAFFRLVLTDARGDRALTRGYFIDELE